MKKNSILITAMGGFTGAMGMLVYLRFLQPRQQRWGATDEEVARPLPGDELVPVPHFNATRAVTIQATPQHIWPWLSQIGFGRAGWYSYDWVDNFGRPSERRIVPELQKIGVGSYIPIFGESGFLVTALKRGHWMVWNSTSDNSTSWYWGLFPIDGHSTRLVTRIRMRHNWLSPWFLLTMLVDMGDIVMMRKCMLGIKERAERTAHLNEYISEDMLCASSAIFDSSIYY